MSHLQCKSTATGHARPYRSTGAPGRTKSHYEAILALLRERGRQGVLASELYDSPHLYGRSPRNRISELRRDGFVISGKAHGSTDWHYILVSASARWSEMIDTSKPKAPEIPWEQRQAVTGLPLFDLATKK